MDIELIVFVKSKMISKAGLFIGEDTGLVSKEEMAYRRKM